MLISRNVAGFNFVRQCLSVNVTVSMTLLVYMENLLNDAYMLVSG